jgi:hypothetical protein
MVVNYSSQQQPLDNERENHTKGAVKKEQTTKITRIPLLCSSTRRIAHTPNNAQHSLPQQQQHPVPKKLTRRRNSQKKPYPLQQKKNRQEQQR